jgi:hypothetical protein
MDGERARHFLSFGDGVRPRARYSPSYYWYWRFS